MGEALGSGLAKGTEGKGADMGGERWNTSMLGLRIGVDALAAGTAGGLVAPVITMIDRGIMENASGRATLKESLRNSAMQMVRRPGSFFWSKPFGLVFSLYFGTYLTANLVDTTYSTLPPSSPSSSSTPHQSFSTTHPTLPKFLATSTTNLTLCLYKDTIFTRLYGPRTAPRPIPLPTLLLFTTRDLLTIFASFNLPPLLVPRLEREMGKMGGIEKWMSAASVAQFLAPAVVQGVSTPLHLLGLDLYNRPGEPGKGVIRAADRAGRVLRDWGVSCLARMGRIVPAFGVGGVVNMKVRKGGMGWVEGRAEGG